MARPMLAVHEIQLRLDHGVERLEQLRKASRPTLEQRERGLQRLDRRQAMCGWLAADPVTTLRRRREAIAGERLQKRVELVQLGGLPPSTVDYDQRDRTRWGLEREILRIVTREEQNRRRV